MQNTGRRSNKLIFFLILFSLIKYEDKITDKFSTYKEFSGKTRIFIERELPELYIFAVFQFEKTFHGNGSVVAVVLYRKTIYGAGSDNQRMLGVHEGKGIVENTDIAMYGTIVAIILRP